MAEVINLFNKEPIEDDVVFVEPEVNLMTNLIEGLVEVQDRLDHLIVIGSSAAGEFFFASSGGDTRQIIYDLDTAHAITMNAALQHRFNDDED